MFLNPILADTGLLLRPDVIIYSSGIQFSGMTYGVEVIAIGGMSNGEGGSLSLEPIISVDNLGERFSPSRE